MRYPRSFLARSDESIGQFAYCKDYSCADELIFKCMLSFFPSGLEADECVSDMRKSVQEETNLTVSAGIAPNKVNTDFAVSAASHICFLDASQSECR